MEIKRLSKKDLAEGVFISSEQLLEFLIENEVDTLTKEEIEVLIEHNIIGDNYGI
jgi:hypothetical protein